MKKIMWIMPVLVIVLVLAGCSDGGSGTSLKIPAIANLSVASLSEYDISGPGAGPVPADEEEALKAFGDAFDIFNNSGIDFFGDAMDSGDGGPSPSIAREAYSASFDYVLDGLDEEYEDYGISNLAGWIRGAASISEESLSFDFGFRLSYQYDSDDDTTLDPGRDCWVKGKVNLLGDINMYFADEYYSMKIGEAYSIALAYYSPEVSGKFILNFGLAVSDNNGSVDGPLYYATLLVYDAADVLQHTIDLNVEDISDFELINPDTP